MQSRNHGNHATTYKRNGKHSARSAEKRPSLQKAATQVKKIANALSTQLSALGLTVSRGDSVSTNSAYLMIDYGLGGSVRISDHPGRKSQKHRYSILLYATDRYEITGLDCKRTIYPPWELNDVVMEICMELGWRSEQLGGMKIYLEEKERQRKLKEGIWGYKGYAEEVERDEGNVQ